MVTSRYGGVNGTRLDLEDHGDLVVVRSARRGRPPELLPLAGRSRAVLERLTPLFSFPASGVGVFAAPSGGSEELAAELAVDPEVQFAGRGLADPVGEPVVYTENAFVKFADDVPRRECLAEISRQGLEVRRRIDYLHNAWFVAVEEGAGRAVFDRTGELLEEERVDVCHPELVRERSARRAFPPQWHLRPTTVGGVRIEAHVEVTAAWRSSRGAGTVIAVIDDGVDIDHEEFSSASKIVAPRSFGNVMSDDPRPGAGDNHGTAAAGVACADGRFGASGVAPDARLMPIRNVSGLGSQDEADAIAWAARNGADVVSCSWGPVCGPWWEPANPRHDQVVPLPDSTRLAIDFAVRTGRDGRGCVVVWAAGNGAESVDNDGYAANPDVVAVAACNDRGERSVYSDHGKAIWCSFPSNDFAADDRPAPVTPGIWTTDRRGRTGYNPGSATLGDVAGHYTNAFGGTSSACPGVAGVAALVLARSPGLTAAEVREVLKASADRIDDTPGEYDASGHSPNYGHGRVNAAAAVRLAARKARHP
jgi:subtilisin family serine protease